MTKGHGAKDQHDPAAAENLAGQLHSDLANQLHSAAIHLLRQLRKEDDASGLSAPRLSALSVVVFGGPLTLGELARAEQVKPPTMTRIVTGLEKQGLVKRKDDASDGRLTHIEATAKGRKILLAGRARRVEKLASAVGRLSREELADLRRGVQLVGDVVASMRGDRPKSRDTIARPPRISEEKKLSRPKSDFDALRQDLKSVYNGSPWHGSSITAVLKSVDAEGATLRSIPRGHNIWELVLHMTAWTREVTSRVQGGAPKSPPEDWPVPPARGGNTAWRATQEELAAAQRELERAVDALKAEDLVIWIGDERDPALGAGVTVGTLIRGLLQHHAYHQGQIALLKKAVDTFQPGRRKA